MKNLDYRKFKNYNLQISLFLSIFVLFVWYLGSFEYHPYDDDSHRWNILRQIIISFNNGYYFQINPLIPMETEWEDPGFAFWTLIYGIVKKGLFNLYLDPYKDPYIVELIVAVLVVVFSLNKLKNSKYIFIIPVSLIAFTFINEFKLSEYSFFNNDLLYLSYGMHWVKTLSAMLFFTMTITFFKDLNQNNLNIKQIIIDTFLYGIIFGLLISLRSDIFIPVQFSIFIYLSIIIIKKIFLYKLKDYILKIFLFSIIFFVSIDLPKQIMKTTWDLRDNFYSIKNSKDYSGHPKWHVLIMSLGFVENKYGLEWNDRKAHKVVENIQNKKIEYGSSNHEKFAKDTFFIILKENPKLFIRNFWHKSKILFLDIKNIFVFFITGITILVYLAKRKELFETLIIFSYPTYFLIPLIIEPLPVYYFDLYAISFMIFLYLLFKIINSFKAK